MKVDTDIRHVTKPGAICFLELGSAQGEAKSLQAASRIKINAMRKSGRLNTMKTSHPTRQSTEPPAHSL
jgi:hypothetical protein